MKKLKWFIIGYVVGFATALWLRNRLYRTVDKYTPANMKDTIAEKSKEVKGRAQQTAQDASQRVIGEVRQLAEEVREAITDGRVAMRNTEQELKVTNS